MLYISLTPKQNIMNRLLTLIFSITLLNAAAQKNVPVSTLPAVDSVGQNDYFPLVQGGLYHKAYIWQLPHYVISSPAPPMPPIPVVAQPANQVVFGTGAGISSDSGLSYTPAGLFLAKYKGFGAALGVGNLTKLGGPDSSVAVFAAKNALIRGNNVMVSAGDTALIDAGSTITLGANNLLALYGNNIIINEGHFSNNTVTGNAYIDDNLIYNGAIMANNVVSNHSQLVEGLLYNYGVTANANVLTADTATTGFVPGIQGFELFNACHLDSNIISAAGNISDVRAQALSSITGNKLTGGKQMMDIAGINQTLFDHIDHNLLEGNGAAIQTINQRGNSNITYDTIIGDFSSIQQISQRNSSISNCRLDSSNYSFSNIDMKESGIYNASNINITGLNLQGVNLNLNGFKRNISNENIVNGSGYFAQAINLYSAMTGDSVVAYINLIPPGYSITKIIATANDVTPGVTVIMGLEADDSALVTIASDSLIMGNLVWTGVSKSATANCSFYIQIKSVSILAEMHIYVEIAQLNTGNSNLVYRH